MLQKSKNETWQKPSKYKGFKDQMRFGGSLRNTTPCDTRLSRELFLQATILEETCCSVSSSLPEHAIVATRWCEASGTMNPRETVEDSVRENQNYQHEGGEGLGMNDMVNVM